MRHTDTMQYGAQPGAGHFFCPLIRLPLALPSPLAIGSSPLTLSSPPRGEGEGAA